MMSASVMPPVRSGDVLVLRDEDYLFGQGDLLLRVVVLHEVRQLRDGAWVFLRGMQLRADGTGEKQRDVLVRGEALRTRRRRPL